MACEMIPVAVWLLVVLRWRETKMGGGAASISPSMKLGGALKIGVSWLICILFQATLVVVVKKKKTIDLLPSFL
jgi:hypothetical protein